MDEAVSAGGAAWHDEAQEILALTRERNRRIAARSFIRMTKVVAPWFQVEEVHLLLAGYLEMLLRGEIKRLLVFEPPRAGKSTQGSVLFPAFWMGHNPSDKILQVGHSSDFSTDFGRQCKDTMANEDYTHLYPDSILRKDNKAARRWGTTARGSYYAAGQKSPIAGKGFNLGIWDDLISEQDRDSTVAKQRVCNWYVPGFLSRQQPERNAIAGFTTRWAVDDPAGWLIKQAKVNPSADQYTILKIPAIIDEATADIFNELTHDELVDGDPIKFKPGDSFCPRRHSLSNLLKLKENAAARDWSALWMQEPVDEGGNIYKAEWWRQWSGRIPAFDAIWQVYDTAFLEEELDRGDYNARTTWGIFWHDPKIPKDPILVNNLERERPGYRLFLLERMKRRMGFPELRKEVKDSYDKWKPDRIIIERKASGLSLIQELRRMPRVVVRPFNPKDKSKTQRAQTASVVLEQGLVFYPEDRLWPQEVIDGAAAFPRGDHDDVEDTITMAFMMFRRLYIHRLSDEEDDRFDYSAAPPPSSATRMLRSA